MFVCVYIPQAEQGSHGYSLCGTSVKLEKSTGVRRGKRIGAIVSCPAGPDEIKT